MRLNCAKFLEEVTDTTPHLFLRFDGKDRFEHSVVGAIPPVHLLGAVIRAQHILSLKGTVEHGCPALALFIVYKECGGFEFYLGDGLPLYPLLAMLELIKAQMLDAARKRNESAVRRVWIPTALRTENPFVQE